jgi:hypothetical protein
MGPKAAPERGPIRVLPTLSGRRLSARGREGSIFCDGHRDDPAMPGRRRPADEHFPTAPMPHLFNKNVNRS